MRFLSPWLHGDDGGYGHPVAQELGGQLGRDGLGLDDFFWWKESLGKRQVRAVRIRKKNIGVDDKKLMNIRSVDCVLTPEVLLNLLLSFNIQFLGSEHCFSAK